MAWSRAFLLYITGFCEENSSFANLQIFFADSKRRAQELSDDVSFVIFGHQTWDLVPQQR